VSRMTSLSSACGHKGVDYKIKTSRIDHGFSKPHDNYELLNRLGALLLVPCHKHATEMTMNFFFFNYNIA
jgi:hypothetical protein